MDYAKEVMFLAGIKTSSSDETVQVWNLLYLPPHKFAMLCYTNEVGDEIHCIKLFILLFVLLIKWFLYFIIWANAFGCDCQNVLQMSISNENLILFYTHI